MKAVTHIASDTRHALCGRDLDQVRAFGWTDEYRQLANDPKIRWCTACADRYWQRHLRHHTDRGDEQ